MIKKEKQIEKKQNEMSGWESVCPIIVEVPWMYVAA